MATLETFETEMAPTKAKISGGLCSTCNHAAMCMFLRVADRPIVHCDEFDTSSPDGARAELKIAESQSAPEVTSELTGLCRTCEQRTTCMHVKPGMSVWECNEYC